MQKSFPSPGPVSLYVEIGSGDVRVETAEVDHTSVEVTGRDSEEVTVEQRGDQVVVIGPDRGLGFAVSTSRLHVTVTLPRDSSLETKLGSADLVVSGPLGDARLKSGSGAVRLDAVAGEAVVNSGSGDIRIDAVTGPLRVTTGSGDVRLGDLGDEAGIRTGSGEVTVRSAAGELVVKTGSGDLKVLDAAEGAVLKTGSGAVTVARARRGQLLAKTGSGDIRIGIPAGVPVWTDVSTGIGHVRSNLEGAGEPAEGQDFIELRAKTGTGNVHLEQL